MNEDISLVTNILAKKGGAFEKLVEKNSKLVWHILFRMVQDADVCADLSQEVFLQVFLKLKQFKYKSSLSTWIGRITYNLAVRYLQKNKISVYKVDNDHLSEIEDLDTVSTEEQFLKEESIAQLQKVLNRLAPIERVIISLFHLQESSVEEISMICELPKGTVKSHLYRSRLKLKNMLNKYTLEVL